MLERDFQSTVIKNINIRLPEAIVLKNDPNYKQGIPDLLVLFNNKWAALEVKKSKLFECQPNQEYYISLMNDMSFAAFIYPENMEDVLYEMERSFRYS